MQSTELGIIFEKAAFCILKEIFQCWGFKVTDSKIQRSGTQYGFDLYFRIVKGLVNHNLFIECKASNSFNEIKQAELNDKIAQLAWAGFPRKDFHIFFSPTRAVDYNNQQLSIEDNDWPFVVVDWMRRQGEVSPVLELFAAYEGNDADISVYAKHLFSPEIAPGFTTDKTFSQVCAELKSHLERRINEHNDAADQTGYRIINGTFWSRVQQDTHREFLHYFYTRTDSSPARLREVVANDYDVRNDRLEKEFDQVLRQAITQKSAIIKILSRGGEGKSTFLYRIAKKFCSQHTVIWLDTLDCLTGIKQKIQRLDMEGALIMLLDNAAIYGRELADFAQKLNSQFRKYPLVLVVVEREFRYLNIEGKETLEWAFTESHTIEYRSGWLKQLIFERFIENIHCDQILSADIKNEAQRIFLADIRMSVAESIFAAIKYLKEHAGLRGYVFDWEDWINFARMKTPGLERLYLVLSTFYQFGFSIDAGFCTRFLKGADELDINTALSQNPNLPIYRRGCHLFLRHEALASWFLDEKEVWGQTNRANSELVFHAFLDNINTPAARDLFIWACIKNKDFRRSFLARIVDDEKRIEVLEGYIRQNHGELKCRTELSKIYQQQKKWADAIRLLKEYIDLDPDGLHPRTELSKIYQQQKKWKEAEDILLELKRLDPENLQARTELSKIYQQQKKWKEAEDILLELKRLDPENLQARTELSKIYQQQKKWKEAEDILLEALVIDAKDLRSLTELFIVYRNTDRAKHGEALLLKCLSIKSDDLNSLLEMGKFCSMQPTRREEAEDYFKRLLLTDPENLHAKTELAALYARMRKWPEREKILFEIYKEGKADAFILKDLAQVFQRFKKFRVSIRLLEKALALRADNLLVMADLMDIYAILSDWNNVNTWHTRATKIMRKNPHHRNLDRFRQRMERINLSQNGRHELISLHKVGVIGHGFVEYGSDRFCLRDGSVINYRLKPGDKVYFALYRSNEKMLADFLEPSFEDIEDLSKLK